MKSTATAGVERNRNKIVSKQFIPIFQRRALPKDISDL
jgi:hypothetical protein